ncbi:hypothetical protein H9Q10_05070 [Eikenella sp. S3360]|uniref:Uncharacterized protein n=1 Tax=Eikenella glucosivorans TaxID=2766967 RepID=A0ABS0N9R2_9NEIS|nr:hypothetical protein [Eikenella glucosivorans]MBH5329039.1 hypothetical protein [Eikenella glucosivorans]
MPPSGYLKTDSAILQRLSIMRQTLLISLLSAVVFGLAACSPQDNRSTAPTAAASVAETQPAPAHEAPTTSAPVALEGSWKDAVPVYYQTPDPGLKRALAIIHQGLNDPMMTAPGAKPGPFNNFSVWAAQILATHPDQTMAWCQELRQQHPNNLLILIFKLSGTPDSGKCLSQLELPPEYREVLATPIPTAESFLSLNIAPASLDIHWASFYATGQPEYVYRIVDYVADNAKLLDEKPANPTQQDTENIITYGAARWSLASNMQQQPQIKALVDQHTAGWPAERRQALERALQLQEGGK